MADATVVTHIFSLSSQSAVRSSMPSHDGPDLGRYAKHARDRPHYGLEMVNAEQVLVNHIRGPAGQLNAVRFDCQWWTAGGQLSQVHLRHTVPADPREVATNLKVLCIGREELSMDGHDFRTWIRTQFQLSGSVDLDQDVIQFVDYPVSALTQHLRLKDGRLANDAKRMIYRVRSNQYETDGLIREPTSLNLGHLKFAAHGRGVVLTSGHDAHRTATLRLIASEQIFALGRAREARRTLEDRLWDAQRRSASDRWQDAIWLGKLADDVRRQRITLSLGVRAFTDGLFMPELIFDDFRSSLEGVLRLREVTESSLMLTDTLADVTKSYLELATFKANEEALARERKWRLLVGVTSGLAIPIALLLSFFGVSTTDVDATSSLFDLRLYLMPWAATIAISVLILLLSLRQFRSAGR